MSDIHQILKRYWGFDQFRPGQQAIIRHVICGRDALALLPTGGGKSVCYQVPALAQEGLCLVVSPLIALMKDQVENLKKKGIGALLIYSGMAHRDIVRTLENARDPYFKFLYVSPERLETSLFLEYLPALNINLIAVDEAHCISQWGYDFRPAYLRIAAIRSELAGVPLLALTASATETVQKDIVEKLQLKDQAIFRQSFERKNLSYSVFGVDSKVNKLLQVIRGVRGSGIVYCKSRKRTVEVASLLHMHGVAASFYHAGLPTAERNKRQQQWVQNTTDVMVCTNAFGMGIDKPDVRFVVHMDPPDCLENYYQEAGRCGRDGQKAYAVLLYDNRDVEELLQLHEIRFPAMDQIRQVFSALVNFLQLPLYTGQDQRFNFRFEEFISNFKLNAQTALYSLKALEQDDWLEFNEKNFLPSTAVFTTTKQGLYDFYKTQPALEPLATALLRTYEGIFDFPAFISENLLARLLKTSAEEISKQLKNLSAFGVIHYQPQNDSPQIVFRKNRVKADELQINLNLYKKRKQQFISRVKAMEAYMKAGGCRSQYISHYFGDEAAGPCGICDNCLRQKPQLLRAEEFSELATAISTLLNQKPLPATELLQALQPKSKEKCWQAIRYLQSENSIFFDDAGLLHLNKNGFNMQQAIKDDQV